MSDFFDDYFGWICTALIAAIIVILVFTTTESSKRDAAFMAECMQDHKHYECQALLGQARSSSDSSDKFATGVAIGLASSRR